MSRVKSKVNTVYFPIGTIALPPDLIVAIHAVRDSSGQSVSAIVRAALIHLLQPENLDSKPQPIGNARQLAKASDF